MNALTPDAGTRRRGWKSPRLWIPTRCRYDESHRHEANDVVASAPMFSTFVYLYLSGASTISIVLGPHIPRCSTVGNATITYNNRCLITVPGAW